MIENLDSKYTSTGNYLIAFIDVLGIKNRIRNNLKGHFISQIFEAERMGSESIKIKTQWLINYVNSYYEQNYNFKLIK